MKRISIGLFLTFLLLMVFSACQENVYVDWKLANEKWYAAHKNDPDFITTSSGLCYKVIFPGWDYSRQPNINSTVVVTYKGSLIDGSVFDVQTSPVDISLTSAIEGWKEILPKMHNGASLKLYIPSKLAYDTVSTNTQIPPHSVLIFDINLVDSYN